MHSIGCYGRTDRRATRWGVLEVLLGSGSGPKATMTDTVVHRRRSFNRCRSLALACFLPSRTHTGTRKVSRRLDLIRSLWCTV